MRNLFRPLSIWNKKGDAQEFSSVDEIVQDMILLVMNVKMV